MQTEYILHLDLDGVLSDFDSAFERISGGLTADEYKSQGKSPSKLYLSQGADYWRDLGWAKGGQEILSFSLSNFKLVRILSSAGTGKDWKKYKEVQAGKLDWLSKHAPQIPKRNVTIVPFTNLKARHAGPDRILVDDHARNIDGWKKAGGVGILHDSNNWQETIKELQEYASGPLKLSEIVATL